MNSCVFFSKMLTTQISWSHSEDFFPLGESDSSAWAACSLLKPQMNLGGAGGGTWILLCLGFRKVNFVTLGMKHN